MKTNQDISAKVVADSVNIHGNRLTTMQIEFPRYILAEFNTHRVFSRSSASSRARSLSKTIKEVNEDPYVPLFTHTSRGMSGSPLKSEQLIHFSETQWLTAKTHSVRAARELDNIGVHKSVVNRILEPYMWHTTIVTSTEWENFFTQRLAETPEGRLASDPAMYTLADRMKQALQGSNPIPRDLAYRDDVGNSWHLPFIDREESARLTLREKVFVSVARCAGVSYLTDRTTRSYEQEYALYVKLRDASPPHWAPFEHVATPSYGRYGNFTGWASLRYILQELDVDNRAVFGLDSSV